MFPNTLPTLLPVNIWSLLRLSEREIHFLLYVVVSVIIPVKTNVVVVSLMLLWLSGRSSDLLPIGILTMCLSYLILCPFLERRIRVWLWLGLVLQD